MDHLLEKISGLADDVFVVTNHRFAQQFEEWGKEKDLKIIDDGTMSNEDRLGAIGDIHYVINKCGLSDDIFVIAGDNIFDEDFNDFVKFFNEKNGPCVMVEEKDDINALKRSGVAVIEDDIIVDFEEKPDKPKSSFAVPPVYIYPQRNLYLFDRYMSEGGNPDAPGHFVQWLVKQTRVYSYRDERS